MTSFDNFSKITHHTDGGSELTINHKPEKLRQKIVAIDCLLTGVIFGIIPFLGLLLATTAGRRIRTRSSFLSWQLSMLFFVLGFSLIHTLWFTSWRVGIITGLLFLALAFYGDHQRYTPTVAAK